MNESSPIDGRTPEQPRKSVLSPDNLSKRISQIDYSSLAATVGFVSCGLLATGWYLDYVAIYIGNPVLKQIAMTSLGIGIFGTSITASIALYLSRDSW